MNKPNTKYKHPYATSDLAFQNGYSIGRCWKGGTFPEGPTILVSRFFKRVNPEDAEYSRVCNREWMKGWKMGFASLLSSN